MQINEIRTALPAPQICDVCCSGNVILTTYEALQKRSMGNWPWLYHCEDCGASVGCHDNSTMPLGRMANRNTRRMRVIAHNQFDKLWKSGLMTRYKAYNWLAAELGISYDDCHISMLSDEQLKKTTNVSSTYYFQNFKAIERRKQKRIEEFKKVARETRHRLEQKRTETKKKWRKK